MTSSGLVHIHSGPCDSLGGVKHTLTSFSNGTSATLLDGVSLNSLLTGSLAINAHNAADPDSFTACGDIPAGEVTDQMHESAATSPATMAPTSTAPVPAATSPATTAPTSTAPVPAATAPATMVPTSTAPAPAATVPAQSTTYTPVELTNFSFVPATLQATAGQTARFEVSSDNFSHTFTIQSLGVDVVISAGQVKTIEFEVPSGTSGDLQLVYVFHEGAGMVGTLQVTGGDSSDSTTQQAYYY